MIYLKNLNTGKKIRAFLNDENSFRIDGDLDTEHTLDLIQGHYNPTEIHMTITFDQEGRGDDIQEARHFINDLNVVQDDSVPLLELTMDKLKVNVAVRNYELFYSNFNNRADSRMIVADLSLFIVPDLSSKPSILKKIIDWIKVKFVDEASNPVPGVRCRLLYSDGTDRIAVSNEKGLLDIKDAVPGSYTLRLEDRDKEGAKDPHGVHQPSKDKEEYEVHQGESLSSIAAIYGVPWKQLWDDPDNKELKKKRKNPDILYPGDVLMVPAIRYPEYKFATASEQKVTVKVEMVDFEFVLEDADGPLKNIPCTLNVYGKDIKVTSDGAGLVKTKINASAKEVVLSFPLNGDTYKYNLKVNALDPVEEESGIEQRMINSGVPLTSAYKGQTGEAASAFLSQRGIETTEQLDQDTVNKIKQMYGI